MFKADINLCHEDKFTFEKFYRLIDNFKSNKDLDLSILEGHGTKLFYKFECEKQRIWINVDTKYKWIALELITDECSIDDFNDYYKELCFQAEEFKS